MKDGLHNAFVDQLRDADGLAIRGLVVRDAVPRRVVGAAFDTLQEAVVAAFQLTFRHRLGVVSRTV